MKWALIVVGGLAGLAALAFIAGSMLPKGHVASRTLRLKQPPEAVWKAITDYESMTSWRADLTAIARMPDRAGRAVWKETMGGMEIPLADAVVEPPRKLVREIADASLPFGGTWTYELAAEADGCTLRITEDGFVTNPLFRLISRMTDQSSTITKFLTSLAAKFGEPPRIE